MLIGALGPGGFTADLPDQSLLPKPCENNMNQALKSRPRLVRISSSRPCFFDILVNSQACIKDQTARQESGEAHLVSSMRERAKEAKYLQCTKKEKFAKISKLLPLRYGPKRLVESRPQQAVLLMGPSYILRTIGVDYLPLASSADMGLPSFSWALWWAVQKQKSQQTAA